MQIPTPNHLMNTIGIDEELYLNRKGTPLGIAIALGDGKLTEEEILELLTPLGLWSQFDLLSPDKKDIARKMIFSLWSLDRMGRTVERADTKVLALVPQLENEMKLGSKEISEQLKNWLTTSLPILVTFLGEESNMTIKAQLQKSVEKFVAAFLRRQESLEDEIKKHKSIPGADGMERYLLHYRGIKVKRMRLVGEKLFLPLTQLKEANKF